MMTKPEAAPCKNFSLPANTLLTGEALNLLHDMLLNLPPHDLRNTFLELYHNYVRHEHESLPVHFDEMVTHFYCLDNFFKAIVAAQLNTLHSKEPVGGLHQ
jgi:hypothetical protein